MQHSPIDASGNADALDPRILRLAQALAELVAPNSPADDARDELVSIGECGIERAAVLRLVRSGQIASRRLGRKLYVLRSELVGLVSKPKAPTPAAGSPEIAYLDVIRRAKAKGGR